MNLSHKLEKWIIKNVYKEDNPGALSLMYWGTYQKEFRERHPVHYFIFEKVIPKIEIPYVWCSKAHDALYWGFHDHTRVVRPKTLSKGWHDSDEILMHSMFHILVDYVDREMAHMYFAFMRGNKNSDNTKIPFAVMIRRVPGVRFFFPVYRSSEYGLKYLKDKIDFYQTDPEFKDWSNPHKTILELYEWWTVTRPARPDPYDVSGWTKYCVEEFDATIQEDCGEEATKHKYSILDKLRELEAQYEKEDQEMMHKLVDIHKALWT